MEQEGRPSTSGALRGPRDSKTWARLSDGSYALCERIFTLNARIVLLEKENEYIPPLNQRIFCWRNRMSKYQFGMRNLQ